MKSDQCDGMSAGFCVDECRDGCCIARKAEHAQAAHEELKAEGRELLAVAMIAARQQAQAAVDLLDVAIRLAANSHVDEADVVAVVRAAHARLRQVGADEP